MQTFVFRYFRSKQEVIKLKAEKPCIWVMYHVYELIWPLHLVLHPTMDRSSSTPIPLTLAAKTLQRELSDLQLLVNDESNILLSVSIAFIHIYIKIILGLTTSLFMHLKPFSLIQWIFSMDTLRPCSTFAENGYKGPNAGSFPTI